MSTTVGIDLGTTNSCIAVPASTEISGRADRLESGRLLAVGDALIVTDEERSALTPSAVWVGPEGEVLVGARAVAESRNPGSPPPARFFKRAMGWSAAVPAGHATLTPVEASAHVLRHLARVAADVLGQPVERAVITVPAHFEKTAKNATTEAAELAGLEVADTLTEPVAGALAYLDQGVGNDAETTFLVYDLGGGTFDVSVVTSYGDGSIELRATDGDRFLGGFDIDKDLVQWVVDEAVAYDLTFDENVPEDRATRERLLRKAELLKIDLSTETYATLLEQHAVDRQGQLLNVKLPMSRTAFDAMVAPRLASTLEITRRVVETARLGPEDIDEVLLVGGSTRIPAVEKLLHTTLARAPRALDVDLCVGVGAALRTASLDVTADRLEVARPEVDGRQADVTGRVRPGGSAGQVVALTREDGVVRLRTHADEDGRFAFLGVDLAEGDNAFHVELVVDGRTVDALRVTAVRGAVAPAAPDPVLARTFFLLTRSGRLTVAEGGATKVPHTKEVALETVGHGTALVVPVYEGDLLVGELRIDGLPADLPFGTAVDVVVEFTADWRIHAAVRVPSVDAVARGTFEVPHVELDPWDTLESTVDELAAAWGERRRLLDGDARFDRAEVDRLLAELRQLLAQRDDRVKTNARLRALELAMPPLPASVPLRPPPEELEAAFVRVEQLCAQLEVDEPRRAGQFRDDLTSLRAKAEAAARIEDRRAWANVATTVEARRQALRNALVPPLPAPSTPPDAGRQRDGLLNKVIDAERRVSDRAAEDGARHRTAADALLERGAALREHLLDVDPDAREADGRLRDLATDVAAWSADVADFPSEGVIDVQERHGPRRP